MPLDLNGTTGASAIQDGAVSATAKLADGIVTPVKTQPGALPSMVRVNSANGYGAVNTVIRRFTNVVTNQGTDITYADSANNGASFTINTSGVYSTSYADQFSPAALMGVSLNSSQLTTAIQSITAADRLTETTTVAGSSGYCGVTQYLAAGSVIRPHTDGSAAVSTRQQFTIQRVA